jgi:hypothetical protein
MTRRTMGALMGAFFMLGCADSATAPRSLPNLTRPALAVAPGDSIPVPLSAVTLGPVEGATFYEAIEITWADVSGKETLISALFVPSLSQFYAAQTQNIGPKPGTGTRVDTVYAYAGYRAVQLTYRWAPFPTTEPTTADTWGMSSPLIEITEPIAVTATRKRGKK